MVAPDWSRKIVGWGVNQEQCGDFAAQLLEATCDGLGVATRGMRLHADNGKPMKGSSMLSTMQWLGIVPSFSRPHVSDDNPYVESLFRTLKYRPGAAGMRFDTLDDAVLWVERFARHPRGAPQGLQARSPPTPRTMDRQHQSVEATR